MLLLADILPTGVFAALQVLQHPKISPILTGKAYPFSSCILGGVTGSDSNALACQREDRILTLAVVGLGPVGVVSVQPLKQTLLLK